MLALSGRTVEAGRGDNEGRPERFVVRMSVACALDGVEANYGKRAI